MQHKREPQMLRECVCNSRGTCPSEGPHRPGGRGGQRSRDNRVAGGQAWGWRRLATCKQEVASDEFPRIGSGQEWGRNSLQSWHWAAGAGVQQPRWELWCLGQETCPLVIESIDFSDHGPRCCLFVCMSVSGPSHEGQQPTRKDVI